MLQILVPAISQLLGKVIPDTETRDKLAHEVALIAEKQAHEIALAQIAVNKEEAKGGWFRSGWRPLTGYVCVLGFFVNFLVSPLAAGFGVIIPQADVGTMMPVLMGMLGLGAMRTVEKTKGFQ